MTNQFSEALDMLQKRVDNKVPNQSGTIGVTSVPTYGGYITSAEKNADLSGSQKYVTYSEILANVGIIAAGVRYFLNLVAKAKWSASPVDDTEEAQEAADFVQDVMGNMDTPWPRVVRRAAMYRFYGYSIQEWTAKTREDGKIGMLDIEPRAQSTISRWDVNQHGDIKTIYQQSPHDYREIALPREKLIYVVDDSLSDSPEGLGLFRHITPHAKRVMRYEQLEGIGYETDLRGVPIGRAPKALLQAEVDKNTMTKDDMDAALLSLETFIQNHIRSADTGLVLDSLTYASQDERGIPSPVKQWDLELVKSSSSSLKELGSAIDRLTHTIAMIMGVEQLLLGRDSRGSHALSVDKTHNFYLVVDSTLTELTEAYQKDFVETLWQLNGFDDKLKPTLTPETIRFQNITEITSALADLSKAGAKLSPADPVINEIRELLGLVRVPEELINQMITDITEPPNVQPDTDENSEDNDEEESDVTDSRDE